MKTVTRLKPVACDTPTKRTEVKEDMKAATSKTTLIGAPQREGS